MRMFGLIGNPLSHSFSKQFFTRKFESEGISDCRYENFEMPSIDGIRRLIQTIPSLEGINVTIPYKEQVIPYLDWQNEVVKATGACNCILIKKDRLYGFNTDTIGFERSLIKDLLPHHKRALVLGTGGASKSVNYILEKLQIEYLNVSRSKAPEPGHLLSYDELTGDMLESHTLIINTTPIGMYPAAETAPPLDYKMLGPQHYLYDLIYNPEKTLFLRNGEERGAITRNGNEMLIIQAEESWKIWNEEIS